MHLKTYGPRQKSPGRGRAIDEVAKLEEDRNKINQASERLVAMREQTLEAERCNVQDEVFDQHKAERAEGILAKLKAQRAQIESGKLEKALGSLWHEASTLLKISPRQDGEVDALKTTLQSSKGQLKKKEATLLQVEKEKSDLEASYESTKMNIQLLRKRIDTLEQEKDRFKGERTILEAEVAQKEASMESYSSKVKSLTEEHSKKSTWFKEKTSIWKREISDLQEQISIGNQHSSENTNLRERVEELKADIRVTRTSRTAASEELSRAQVQYSETLKRKDDSLSKAEKERHHWMTSYAKVRRELENVDRAVNDLNTEKEELENNIGVLETSADIALEMKDHATSKAEKHLEHVRTLKSEIDLKNREMAEAEASHNVQIEAIKLDFAQEVEDLDKQLMVSQASASDYQSLAACLDAERQALRQRFDEEENENLSLTEQLSKMTEAMESLKREQVHTVTQLRSEKRAVESELLQIKTNCQEMADINQDLETEKKRLEGINATQTSSLFDARTQLSELQDSLENKRSHVGNLRDEYRGEMTALREEFATSRREVAALKNSLRECEEKLELTASKAHRERSVAQTTERNMREEAYSASEREKYLNAELDILHGIPTPISIHSLIGFRGYRCDKVSLSVADVSKAVEWQQSELYAKKPTPSEPGSIPATILALHRHLFLGQGEHYRSIDLLLDLWCTLDHLGSGALEHKEEMYLMAHEFSTKVLTWLVNDQDSANTKLIWLTTEILSTLATWQCPAGQWREVDTKVELAMEFNLPFFTRLSTLRLQSLIAPLIHNDRPKGLDHVEIFEQIQKIDESGRLFVFRLPGDTSTVLVGLCVMPDGQFFMTKREGRPTTINMADYQRFMFIRSNYLWNLVIDRPQGTY
jgi:hypothetical protein